MAEWSKAEDSSSFLFGGAGSNPAPVRFCLAHRDVQRGCSSNGRALAQHARGTGIDTLHLHSLQTRSRQDSNLRGQSPVDFWSTPLTAWVRLLTRSAKCDEGGVRTHASEEIAALTQRLRPLGHLATATPCGTRTRNLWIRSPTR